MTLTLVLPITPVGKGRPRLGKGKTFTPLKTKVFEEHLRILYRVELAKLDADNRGNFPTDHRGGVVVHLEFYFERPALPVRDFPSDFDLDNLVKSVTDAGNGILWKDDNLIREVHALKLYGEKAMIVMRLDYSPSIPRAKRAPKKTGVYAH